MEIGIVILNYLNWTDTVECIDSLKNQTHQFFQVVVVDNASKNESFAELTSRYENNEKIHLLQTEENLGFAKGNNTGIIYCKSVLGLENILVINNDVIFTDVNYLAFLSEFDCGEDIGVVGTKIIGSDGLNQNPHYFNPTHKAVLREYALPLMRKYHLGGLLVLGSKIKNRGRINTPTRLPETIPSERPYVLHGSAIFLTKNYVKQLNGLYPETFLYYEEEILGLVCKKIGLKMLYTDEVEIYHKEDQSSQMSFQNLEGIKQKFARKSVKIGLRVSRMSPEKITAITNKQSYSFILKKDGKVKKYTFHH